MQSLSYKQIKWLILLLPTVTVGLWEYVRHTPYMLKHLSMEAGNWLTPVIVFAVTIVFVRKLFKVLEDMQKKLEQEKASKAMLEEREKIARQLHDGIAQSLFLLSVKLNQLESKQPQLESQQQYQKVRKTVQHMHDDVRQSIFNLRHSSSISPFPWTESLHQLIHNFQEETGLSIQFEWNISEENLTAKEKIELFACIKEALMNVHKHASANNVVVRGSNIEKGWTCTVEDDGIGITPSEVTNKKGNGIEIMQDRAREMDWDISWQVNAGRTKVEISKGEMAG